MLVYEVENFIDHAALITQVMNINVRTYPNQGRVKHHPLSIVIAVETCRCWRCGNNISFDYYNVPGYVLEQTLRTEFSAGYMGCNCTFFYVDPVTDTRRDVHTSRHYCADLDVDDWVAPELPAYKYSELMNVHVNAHCPWCNKMVHRRATFHALRDAGHNEFKHYKARASYLGIGLLMRLVGPSGRTYNLAPHECNVINGDVSSKRPCAPRARCKAGSVGGPVYEFDGFRWVKVLEHTEERITVCPHGSSSAMWCAECQGASVAAIIRPRRPRRQQRGLPSIGEEIIYQTDGEQE